MAEIPVQKKTSYAWLWVLLALLLFGLLLWWILAETDEEAAPPLNETAVVQPVEPVEPGAPVGAEGAAPGADAAGMTIPAILANPSAYFGREFTGEVDVPTVATDRGFWVEADGQRMLAIILDEPREQPKDINPGQRLRITGATVRDASAVEDLRGDALEADTQRLLEQQQAFLLVPEENIEILQEGTPQ